jgi:hypothetical protein
MKRTGLASVGAVVLAFLASQHHNLHMLLLAFGLGGAGTSFIQAPGIRRAMLLLSLGMVAVSLASLRRTAGTGMRGLIIASAAVTLGLVTWSVLRLGF